MASSIETGHIQLTRDEANKLSDAFKDEKFRALFAEYAEEIRSPENRALYEKEITQLEKERGVDVTFINPEPCYVLKTSVDGEKKAFLNVCTNANVKQPTCHRTGDGYNWSIPYSLAPPREDWDKEKRRCVVYDVVFHPDTVYMASRNPRFKKLIEDTSMEGVEKNFKVTLDRKNIKHPKMKFKGFPVGTVIRKTGPTGLKCPPPVIDGFSIPYPEVNSSEVENQSPCPKVNKEQENQSAKVEPSNKCNDINGDTSTPKYAIKYRKYFDIEEFAFDKTGAPVVLKNIPKEVIVEIDLPLIASAASVDLDVTDKVLELKTEKGAKYYLNLNLPYYVNSDESKAKFDISTRKLIVTLLVNASHYNVPLSERENDAGTLEIKSMDEEDVQSCEVNANELMPLDENLQLVSENVCNGYVQDDHTNNQLSITKQSVVHSLPSYAVRQSTEQIIIVLHVQNVDPTSMAENLITEKTFMTCSFSSMGSGFVPFHYKFHVKPVEDKLFNPDCITLDVKDFNAVVTLKKHDNHLGYWNCIHVGIDEDDMTEITLDTMTSVSEQIHLLERECLANSQDENKWDNSQIFVSKLSEELLEIQIGTTECIDVRNSENCTVSYLRSIYQDSAIMDDKSALKTIINKESDKETLTSDETKEVQSEPDSKNQLPDPLLKSPRFRKFRSLSESSQDWYQNAQQKPRGILKLRKYSRSISESSDDFSLSSQEIVTSPDKNIPEESSADELGNQMKKSVRFNEVVCRSLFRSNSSILGQRKKNQRKQRAKKRAVQRKMSESEGSEGENESSALDKKFFESPARSFAKVNGLSQVNDDEIDKPAEETLDNQLGPEIINESYLRDGENNTRDSVEHLGNDDLKRNIENDANANTDKCPSSESSHARNGFLMHENLSNVNNYDSLPSNDENVNQDESSVGCESGDGSVSIRKNEVKSKRKRRKKPKQITTHDSEHVSTMLSWEDAEKDDKITNENRNSIAFCNPIIYELDS